MKGFRFFVTLFLVFMLLAACTTPAQPTQTVQSQPTAAQAAQPTQPQPTQPQPTATVPAAPEGKVITANGVSFTLPVKLGTAAPSSIIPESAPDPSAAYWQYSLIPPAYLQFKVQGYPFNPSEAFLQAQVQVFLTTANVDAMQGSLAKINAIVASPSMKLTRQVMPANVFASNFKVISSADGSVRGARMLVIHGNGNPPVTNDGSLLYQFHGVTADGKYYVIVQFPITAPFLPADSKAQAPAGGLSQPSGDTDLQAYMQKAADLLNAGETAGTLSPSIADMDALVQSLKINSAGLMLPAPLPTPTESATQAATTSGCQDQATFKGQEQPKDGQKFAAGEVFTKQWAIYNTGTCTWDSSYQWALVSGDAMGAKTANLDASFSSSMPVTPGQFTNISLWPTAPTKPGTYTSYWELLDGKGNVVPMVGGANNALSVNIVVKGAGSSSSNFDITDLSGSIVQSPGGDPKDLCTANAVYLATIKFTANGAGNLDYVLSLSDGSGQIPNGNFKASGTPEVNPNLPFTAAGPAQISVTIVGPYSVPDQVTLRIKTKTDQGMKAWPALSVACK